MLAEIQKIATKHPDNRLSAVLHPLIFSQEAETQKADFPEDQPAILARALIYVYCGTYPDLALKNIVPNEHQFSGVEEDYDEQSLCAKRVLHATMFALAVKLCDDAMKNYARVAFRALWYKEPGILDNNCCATATCENNLEIFKVQRIIYDSTPARERDLRDIVVHSAQFEIQDTNLMASSYFRDALCGHPEFSVDLVTYPLTSMMAKCEACEWVTSILSKICTFCQKWVDDCTEDCWRDFLMEKECLTCFSKGLVPVVELSILTVPDHTLQINH